MGRRDSRGSPRGLPLTRIRVELHCHTYWSPDCGVNPERLLETARRKGLDMLAITDHNQIGGAFEARDLGTFPVIVGEEIKTDRGELLGYFLQEYIPPGMSVRDTARAIMEQGGIVSVPHPFDRYRASAIERDALLEVAPDLDMIEIFNSRNIKPEDNDDARHFQEARELIPTVGSDAHSLIEVGRSYQEIEPFNGAPEFLAAMAHATLTTRKSSKYIHFISTYQKLRKCYVRRATPAGAR